MFGSDLAGYASGLLKSLSLAEVIKLIQSKLDALKTGPAPKAEEIDSDQEKEKPEVPKF
jgi:hypothetical protein